MLTLVTQLAKKSKHLVDRPTVPLPALMGLNAMPAGPRRKDKFFFTSPMLTRRLAMLKHSVNGHSPVVVVVGERGSGKSTLIRRFVADTANRWQACRIRLRTRNRSGDAMWRNLDNRLVFISKRNSLPTVIIDDAHQLTTGELKLLLGLACSAPERRRIQCLILFAEPAMRGRLAEIARRLPPRTTIDKIFMAPLTEKQTEQYLAQRIKAAGVLKKNPFSKSHIRKIFHESGGLPGWINGSAFRVLKKIYRGKSHFKQPIVPWLLANLDLRPAAPMGGAGCSVL